MKKIEKDLSAITKKYYEIFREYEDLILQIIVRYAPLYGSITYKNDPYDVDDLGMWLGEDIITRIDYNEQNKDLILFSKEERVILQEHDSFDIEMFVKLLDRVLRKENFIINK